ncbi:MAG: ATP-binding cassette domain-containing protein [Flavobacteriales bacterium]|nr:ATP-binding cassette domain-containing protein [Flavobacteriales bacterium]
MSEVTGKAFDLDILGRVLKYVRPYRSRFVFTFFLTVVIAAVSPLRPMLIQYTFDHYIVKPDAEGLLRMTLITIGVLVLEGVLYYFYTYSANWLGQTVIKDLRMEIYRHINSLKLRFFDKTAIGTLVTRVVSDIETIADIFSNGILVIFGDILKLITVIAVMFWFDWQLALISLSTIPLLLVATYIFKNGIRSSFQDVRTQVSRLNAFLQEHITGMHIVQIFNREEKEMERFKVINAQHRDAHIRSVWYFSIFLPVVEILSATSLGLMVWWGGNQVMAHQTTVGELVAFILYIHMLFRPIRELADKFNTLQMGVVSSERVFKILDTTEHIEDNGTERDKPLYGNIEFDHVWFAYNEEEYVLKDVSFSVNVGETLALVGATGSGKTSIINLLSRFYEYNKGEIRVDGKNIREYSKEHLRKNIAVVLQDVFLFSDTIYRNITLGDDSITMETVMQAAKDFGAHEFISELPGGYEYNVMERGAMLSVGQRQLISFIRAYVHNPSILVLDEATSSIDTESEHIIQKALAKLMEGRTSIVIAHRLATIQTADKILVMEKGKVLEMGSHQQLLGNEGHYRTLFELQFS